jgi:hypothetical protein
MLMPSIALATGPYDWSEAASPRAVYELRLSRLREIMRVRGLTHALVYGNTFDHEALAWFSHFTPKLGPAMLFVPLDGAPRLVFSGGPGMKPSAARLTWVEDVSALRGLGKDLAAWLDGASAPRVGIVCGASILHGDFEALRKGAGGALIELDAALETAGAAAGVLNAVRRSARLLQLVADHLFQIARQGDDLARLALDTERFAYAHGAQDVRLRLARKPKGRPVTPPDAPLPMTGPAPVALAVRMRGAWATGDLVLGDLGALANRVRAHLETSSELRAYANRVAFPEPPFAKSGLVQAFAQVDGAIFSALCVEGPTMREFLFRPPGL